jgi:hypothetical protein
VSDDDMLQVIREAERIVRAAGWHLQEQAVLERLAGIRGLACARSAAIQLVTYDGEHLGHIRRDSPAGPGERWVAVLKDGARQIGAYGSPVAAAAALAHACGKRIGRIG